MENKEVKVGDTVCLKSDLQNSRLLTVGSLKKDRYREEIATCYYVEEGYLNTAKLYSSALKVVL